MGSNVVWDLGASCRRTSPTAIGQMQPSFFPKGSGIGRENRIRAKSLICPLRRVRKERGSHTKDYVIVSFC